MTSYVDDCDLDRSRATSRARLKGCANTICSERSGTHAENFLVLCRGHRLTQGDFTAKVLEDAVKLGFGPIRVCRTAGQSVTPPDPKLLPEQPCDPGVRELIGSLLFLSTLHTLRHFLCYCTTCQICHALVRVGSKGNQHILGFVAHTAE